MLFQLCVFSSCQTNPMTKEYSTLHMHSVHFRNLTYSSVVFILAATFFFVFFLHPKHRGSVGCERWGSDLPIPDEPRKRKTRGCSSSYQPFSFLLMAEERRHRQREKEKKGRLLFHSFAFVDFAFPLSNLSFTQLNRADPRAAGIPETMIKERESGDEKKVRDIWWRKKRRKKRENRARERDERPPESYPWCLSSSPLPQSVGPLASSNCVSLPGAAMAKSV